MNTLRQSLLKCLQDQSPQPDSSHQAQVGHEQISLDQFSTRFAKGKIYQPTDDAGKLCTPNTEGPAMAVTSDNVSNKFNQLRDEGMFMGGCDGHAEDNDLWTKHHHSDKEPDVKPRDMAACSTSALMELATPEEESEKAKDRGYSKSPVQRVRRRYDSPSTDVADSNLDLNTSEMTQQLGNDQKGFPCWEENEVRAKYFENHDHYVYVRKHKHSSGQRCTEETRPSQKTPVSRGKHTPVRVITLEDICTASKLLGRPIGEERRTNMSMRGYDGHAQVPHPRIYHNYGSWEIDRPQDRKLAFDRSSSSLDTSERVEDMYYTKSPVQRARINVSPSSPVSVSCVDLNRTGMIGPLSDDQQEDGITSEMTDIIIRPNNTGNCV